MYKIRLDKDRLDDLTSKYLIKYKKKLREEIKGFLSDDGRFVFKRSVGTSPKKTFYIKACSYPKSFTYQFLQDCVDPNNKLLDSLLIGDVKAQISIIQRVINDDPIHLEKLTAEKAAHLGYKDGSVVDDFNTIMNEIFVKRSFEGDKSRVYAEALDKDEFVKNLNIRICPYCGRAYIYRVEKEGKAGNVSVKPQLDHFLPKKNYPFLGMNFFNLIPCCTQCNLAPCKVDNDPLGNGKQQVAYLMHPYDFDETMIRFVYKLNSPDTYKPESYDVMVGYKNKDYKTGYNGFLAIDKLYAGQNVELRNMFLRARALRAAGNGFYKGIGIKNIPIGILAQGILGFNLNGIEERRQLMYKFQKDTFLQMAKKTSAGGLTSYYVDWEGKELIVKM